MEEALRAYLLADSGVTAQVGTRVYWGRIVQGATYPAVRLNLISSPRLYSHDGDAGTRSSLVQIDCMAPTYAAAKAALRAIIAHLSGAKGAMSGGLTLQAAFVVAERDGNDDDPAQPLDMASADVTLWTT